MGVDVALVSGNHEPIQEVFDNHAVVSKLAMSAWPKLQSSVCLRFVDPCGDAVFNQAQISHLLAELRQEEGRQTDARFREHLQKIIRLVEPAVGRAHTYIKFIGD